MKRKVLDFSVMKEEISQNNVLEMAELIAFMELRFQIGYLGSRAQKMYADLYTDIKHKNESGYLSLLLFLLLFPLPFTPILQDFGYRLMRAILRKIYFHA